MDDEAYLQPGFDPNALKVAELRGILHKHDVDFAFSAKKAQLVDLFTHHITPKSKSILEGNGRIRATSRGIQDVDQYGEPVAKKTREQTASPRKRSRSRRRTTARYGVAESMDGGEAPATVGNEPDLLDAISTSPVKAAAPPKKYFPTPVSVSPVKRPSGKARLSDWERPAMEDAAVQNTPRPGRKPMRKSLAPPSPPAELDAEAFNSNNNDDEDRNLQNNIQQEEEESVFSSENPFQSGSPAATAGRSPAIKDNRRKSLPKGTTLTGLESSSTRRRTDFPALLPSTEPRKRFSDISPTIRREFPASRLRPPAAGNIVATLSHPQTRKEEQEQEHEHVDNIAVTEEFTPEAQQELAELEKEGEIVRRRHNDSKTGHATSATLWALLGTLLLAYFIWWRKEKFEIGYCNVGKALYKPHDETDWASFLRPGCEPCPQNAICKPNFEIQCRDDYVLKPHSLSLWGLIPLPPTCEPDSAKFQRIQYLAEEAANFLREREAAVECGSLKLGKGEARGLSEDELYRRMHERKSPKYSDEEFNQLWKQALEDLVSKDEIEATEQRNLSSNTTTSESFSSLSDKDTNTNPKPQTTAATTTQQQTPPTPPTPPTTHPETTRFLRSTSLSKIPLICALRLTLLNSLHTHKLNLLLLLAFVASALQLQIHRTRSREYQKLVTKYVHVALQTLAKQARISSSSASGMISPFVPVVQLRDQVLQHEFDAVKRRKVWEGVQRVVEGNSNVRATSREIQGEVLRCWCWIGGVGQIEGLGIAGGAHGRAIAEAEMEEALMLSGNGKERIVA